MSYQQFRPPSFQILPTVVKNLMIINGIFFLATIVIENKFGYDLTTILGLHYISSPLFYPHQFLSHLFMHGNFMHLLSNMFALWMFGSVLENYWGPKRFLIYYLATGLGAAFIHTLFTAYEVYTMKEVIDAFAMAPTPDAFKVLTMKYNSFISMEQLGSINNFYSAWVQQPNDGGLIREAVNFSDQLMQAKINIPTVGASGAVFAALFAFGYLFPNTLIYVYFAIPIKAKWFVTIYGLFELYSGIQNNPGDNVAHFAHLGGMLFGYLLIKNWNRNKFRSI
jgi:membrane associated rhomboid family serine protease